MSLDSFKCRKTLKVGSKSYQYFSLAEAEQNYVEQVTEAIASDESGETAEYVAGLEQRTDDVGGPRALQGLGPHGPPRPVEPQLEVAAAHEAATDWRSRRPPSRTRYAAAAN